MKKVLIISYFFSPCNLTAANRISNWETFLPDYNFFPVIITRHWSGVELNEYQRLESSNGKEKVIKNAHSEIHYLPYISSYRDFFFIKGENSNFFRYLSKFLTLINLFFQNFFISFIPFNNLYFKAKEILKNHPEIETLIISANPFEQFFFGYLLKKEFPRIKWIADYRDDWNTTELVKNRTFIQKIIHKFEMFSEKKWLSNAALFTSVSPHYVNKICGLTKKEGKIIYNGFNEELLKYKHNNAKKDFFVTYNGSLYPTQDIAIFLVAFIKFINKYSNQYNIKIFFPGLEYNMTEYYRVFKYLENYKKHFFSSDRISKQEVINIQLKSDLLLMVAHSNIKGVPSSKIFEYIGLRKAILLCPSDNDILKDIVSDIELGSIAESVDDCYKYLCRAIEQKSVLKANVLKINKYSAKHQTKKLAKILDSL